MPLLMRMRDIAFTMMAWMLLMYFMRDLWVLIYEYIRDAFLRMDSVHLIDWGFIWAQITPFLYVAALLMLWILILGSLRRRAILRTGLIQGKNSLRTVQQQFPMKQIDLALLAGRFGVEKAQLAQWQKMRTVDVTVDDGTGSKTIVEVNRTP